MPDWTVILARCEGCRKAASIDQEQTAHSTVCCRCALLLRVLGAGGAAASDMEREDHCFRGALGTVDCFGGALGTVDCFGEAPGTVYCLGGASGKLYLCFL
jgi:hypothetical protein